THRTGSAFVRRAQQGKLDRLSLSPQATPGEGVPEGETDGSRFNMVILSCSGKSPASRSGGRGARPAVDREDDKRRPYQLRSNSVLFGAGRGDSGNESGPRAPNRSVMQTRWRIELLGRFRASWGEHELSRFPRQKAADLLAYLACARGRSASREALIELL